MSKIKQTFQVKELGTQPLRFFCRMKRAKAMECLENLNRVFALSEVSWAMSEEDDDDGMATIDFVPDNGMVEIYERRNDDN